MHWRALVVVAPVAEPAVADDDVVGSILRPAGLKQDAHLLRIVGALDEVVRLVVLVLYLGEVPALGGAWKST